ncbi:MAG TPA: DUF488 domain-containing protein [Chitinophagaceae bacterium]|jgi:uncharacterized protein (DUF488 family)|nr:DUF488 domain-containing protein [Chitinophagaceae bacterium]
MDLPLTPRSIWTIGHSTHSLQDFITMIHSFGINVLADIRSYPGSRRFPHFNQESLKTSLQENGIRYLHYRDLGGRRKPLPDSTNTAWRHAAFRGYADYMETTQFQHSISDLERVAMQHKTAYMCSEAVWWRCHRALVSDYLKIRNWEVKHITSAGSSTLHPFTSAARVEEGKLLYTG